MKPTEKPRGISARYGNLYCSFVHPDFGRCREVIAPAGIPLKDTKENVRAAEKFLAGVKHAIAMSAMGGPAFDYGAYFPDSLRLRRQLQRRGLADTMESVLKHWLEKKEDSRAVKTQKGRASACAEFTARWGERMASDLSVSDILAWIDESRAKKRSIKTVKNRIGFLSGALAEAEQHGIIQFNPVRKINWSSIEPTQAELLAAKENDRVDPFSADEIRAILELAGDYRNMIEAWFASGMRPNEIFALGWEEVGLKDDGSVSIEWGMVEGNWTMLKNGAKSQRLLLLRELPVLRRALERQRASTFMRAAQPCGISGKRRIVFPQLNGRVWLLSNHFNVKVWTPLLRRAGVRYRPPGQIRHSFAVNALTLGEAESWVQEVLGHQTVQMVRQHYGKWYGRSTADKLGRQAGKGLNSMWEAINGNNKTVDPASAGTAG